MDEWNNLIYEGMVTQKDGVVQFVATEENAEQWRKLILQAKEEAHHAYAEEYPELGVDENFILCEIWLKGFVIGSIGICAAAYLKTVNRKWKKSIRPIVDKFWN